MKRIKKVRLTLEILRKFNTALAYACHHLKAYSGSSLCLYFELFFSLIPSTDKVRKAVVSYAVVACTVGARIHEVAVAISRNITVLSPLNPPSVLRALGRSHELDRFNKFNHSLPEPQLNADVTIWQKSSWQASDFFAKRFLRFV